MLKHTRLEPRFVKGVPRALDPGVLYVSMEYSTVVHSCCCGCGMEVVTPLAPTEWQLTYDGEAISLWPSVGNWNLKCRSHYVIKKSRAIEAAPWSNREVAAAQQREQQARDQHYASQMDGKRTVENGQPAGESLSRPVGPQPSPSSKVAMSWLWDLFK